MKKIIVVCMLLVLATAGCLETIALIGGGAAGGMTAARVIQQQKEVNQANIDLMKQQKIDDEAELAATTDEAEREVIQKRLDNTDTVLADLRAHKIVLEGLESGMGTDWSDPESVIPTVTTILMAALAERERRKKNKSKKDAKENKTALVEVVKGGQVFKRAIEANGGNGSVKDFKTAMSGEQSPETKRLVAVAKTS